MLFSWWSCDFSQTELLFPVLVFVLHFAHPLQDMSASCIFIFSCQILSSWRGRDAQQKCVCYLSVAVTKYWRNQLKKGKFYSGYYTCRSFSPQLAGSSVLGPETKGKRQGRALPGPTPKDLLHPNKLHLLMFPFPLKNAIKVWICQWINALMGSEPSWINDFLKAPLWTLLIGTKPTVVSFWGTLLIQTITGSLSKKLQSGLTCL